MSQEKAIGILKNWENKRLQLGYLSENMSLSVKVGSTVTQTEISMATVSLAESDKALTVHFNSGGSVSVNLDGATFFALKSENLPLGPFSLGVEIIPLLGNNTVLIEPKPD